MSPVRDMSVHIKKDVKENISIFKSQFTKDPPHWRAHFLLWICEDSRKNLKLVVATIQDAHNYSPILPKSFPTCSESPKMHVRL